MKQTKIGKRKTKLLLIFVLLVSLCCVPVQAWELTPSVDFTTDSGLNVRINESMNFTNSEVFPTTSSFNASGNITLNATGSANITIENALGSWTNTTDINASANNITINADDKQSVVVGEDVDIFNFTSMQLDDGNADFVYNGTVGKTKVKIFDLPANTNINATENGVTLQNKTSDGSGTVIFNLSNSKHVIHLQEFTTSTDDTNDTTDGEDGDGTGTTEALHHPIVDNSSMSPNHDTIGSSSTELKVDVSDPDMPDDTLSIDFRNADSGATIGTDSLSSNGTAETTWSSLGDGTKRWHVIVTDSDGNSTSSETASFTVDIPEGGSTGIFGLSIPLIGSLAVLLLVLIAIIVIYLTSRDDGKVIWE